MTVFSCENSKYVCICAGVCMCVFGDLFLVGLELLHPDSLWICTYLLKELFATTSLCSLLRLVNHWGSPCDFLKIFFHYFVWWLCKIPEKESSISDTSHKSTEATSTEVALFAVDNCGLWQLLQHSLLQKWGTSRRVFEAPVLLAVLRARRNCQLRTSATCWHHCSLTNAAAVISSMTGTMSCCLVTTLSLC